MPVVACCYCGTGRLVDIRTPVTNELHLVLGDDGWTMDLQEVEIGSEAYHLLVYRCPRHPAPAKHEPDLTARPEKTCPICNGLGTLPCLADELPPSPIDPPTEPDHPVPTQSEPPPHE